jgi:hypothetical protein
MDLNTIGTEYLSAFVVILTNLSRLVLYAHLLRLAQEYKNVYKIISFSCQVLLDK